MIQNCKNCNTVLEGKYCHNCGQKQMLPEDKKLGHLLMEFFHFLWHVDNKFFKTCDKIINERVNTKKENYFLQLGTT